LNNLLLFCFLSVQILGLDADTNYNIEVYAEQISTRLLSKSVDLSFTTKRPSKTNYLCLFLFCILKLSSTSIDS